MNNPLVVSLTGVAKAGKDNFYRLLTDIFPSGMRLSIGDIIRRDCANLILDKFNIDVFNATPEQKEIIRPILAGYGKAQQVATNGKYFTDILDEQIKTSTQYDYFVLTDCRYKNEVDWLRGKKRNVLVHIERRDTDGIYIQPVNEFEAVNNLLLYDIADYHITWHTTDNQEYLKSFAADFYNWLNSINLLNKIK